MKNFKILLILLFVSNLTQAQTLVINELMASNESTISDATGEFADWIEIYNPTNTAINLSGYYITDKPSNPTKHQLPSGVTIGPNAYLILWASDEPTRSNTHLGFKLSGSGEFVGLYQPDGSTVVDTISFGPQRTDISWGRKPNGTGSWKFLTPASPGAGNSSSSAYLGVLDEPQFSKMSGFYTVGFNLSMLSPEPGATIYYTLDGSDPNPNNTSGTSYAYKNSYPGNFLTGQVQTFVYQNAINIVDRSVDPNKLSTINPWYQNAYPTPSQNLFKGTVVRAIVTKPNYLTSQVQTKSYFVSPQGNNRYSLPIFSIALDERSLFEYNTGIYTAGGIFQNWVNANPGQTPNPGTPANYRQSGSNWEKKGNFEMYDNLKNKWYAKPAEFQIQGGYSQGYPRKSFRVKMDMGDLDEKLFPERPYKDYKSFILRSSGQDWNQTLVRDGVVHKIMEGLYFDTQGFRPGILFINGEYWGIQSLRERSHEDFIEQKYGIDKDNLDLLEVNAEVSEGSNAHYLAMLNFIEQNPLSNNANYAYLKTQMDVDNYLDYFIAEIYACNRDWPGNNIKFWRKQTSQYEPNAPNGQDGRWRWMLYDLDNSFGFTTGSSQDLFNLLLNPAGEGFPYQEWSHRLFRRILSNQDAKQYFVTRMADLLNTQFLSTRAIGIIQETKATIAPEMPEHIARWQNPYTIAYWESLFTKTDCCPTGMIYFAQQRPGALRNQLISHFGMGATRNLSVNVADTLRGYVKVNTIKINSNTPGVSQNPYPWTGIYFQNAPVTLVAQTKAGYEFLRWKEGNVVLGTSPTLVLNMANSRSVVAEFGSSSSPGACVSLGSGNWHTANTWDCGRVPNSTDMVTIGNGHVVTINTADAEAKSLQLSGNGNLTVSNNRDLKLYKLN